MRPRHVAGCAVLALTLAGCELGNPLVVWAPDGGVRIEDVVLMDGGTDVALDRGVDVGPSDVTVDTGRDTGPTEDLVDAAMVDDVPTDVGSDAVPMDSGVTDTGPVDTGPMDTGPRDTGPLDTGSTDTGSLDTGPTDTGPRDAGPMDTGPVDAGLRDTGPVDTGVDVPVISDTGPADAGPTPITSYTEACSSTATPVINGSGRYLIAGSTVGRNDDHRPNCADNRAADIGYPIRLSAFSRLTWTARPTGSPAFTPVVYLTRNCQTWGTGDPRFIDELACVSNLGAPALTRGGVVDVPAGDYYLVVDGADNGTAPVSGAFEVTLDVVGSENSPSYSVEPVSTASCTTIPGGAVVINDGDDVVSSVRTLPFSFRYFGTALTRLAVYDNGFFTFLPDSGSAWAPGESWRNHTITFNGPPAGVVAPFWDDLVVTSGGSSEVHQWVDGAMPTRVAHVAWEGVSFYRENTTNVTFEVKLFEGSNIIEFDYCGENRNTTFSRGASATVGIESLDQTAGRLVSLNTAGAIAPGTGYRFVPR